MDTIIVQLKKDNSLIEVYNHIVLGVDDFRFYIGVNDNIYYCKDVNIVY